MQPMLRASASPVPFKYIITLMYWLPALYQPQLKIFLLVYKAQHNLAPSYLSHLLTPQQPTRTLRSTEAPVSFG